MKRSLIKQLRCPACAGALACVGYKFMGEEVIDGVVRCGCGQAYPIRSGVARLLPSETLPADWRAQYAERLDADAPALARLPAASSTDAFSFSYQWAHHQYDALTWELELPERLDIFLRYFAARSFDELQGVRLLDAGCGNGTLSAQLAAAGLEVIAMDYSESVYRAYAHALWDPSIGNDAAARLDYIQGDVWHPPFAPATFDLVYSDGVLHHTPETKRAFQALAPLVRPGGRMFVWLYRRDARPATWVKNRIVDAIRALTRGWSHRNKMRLCWIGAGVLQSVVRFARLFGYRRRRAIPLRLKAVNLFDTISPSYNYEHTPEEVIGWYGEAGFVDVRDVSIKEHRLDDGGFAVIGRRP
ncbi:MAG: methyltransferase domain-containing protein [Chloroflexi bacterium]|nr:MAG: methyltransferase domain-containing protein [Chloroflexota bacterium]